MSEALRLVALSALGAVVLAGCSASRPRATHRPTEFATLPASGTSPTSSSGGPWTEQLSWVGAANGSLGRAYGTCDLSPGDQIDLHSQDQSVDVAILRHAPGVVSVQNTFTTGAAATVTLHLQPENATSPAASGFGYGLYLSTSGTVTYGGPGGDSGSLNVSMLAQENRPNPPSLKLIGQWTCR